MDIFYNDFIEMCSNLRDFPAIPRSIINEYFLERGYKKTTIGKYLKSLRSERKIKYVYIDEEYGLGWRGWQK